MQGPCSVNSTRSKPLSSCGKSSLSCPSPVTTHPSADHVSGALAEKDELRFASTKGDSCRYVNTAQRQSGVEAGPGSPLSTALDTCSP
ncbi:unnamed protein product [Rangifer tarandus platyrhynchus]|uniref:Uncharacterized protein n=1 Tax=Rangifer tarandus platyrhynchus TaxID=3082113 RepID=A0AC59ZL45_RANTA